jgi:hypothetical protein
VRFDAGLALDEEGNLFRTNDKENVRQFVGKPNEDIDANWELLIRMSLVCVVGAPAT